MTIINNQIILAERPNGMPDQNTFRFVQQDVGELKEDQVLVRTLFVSVDPYMRGRMQDAESYVEPYKVNEVIEGGAIGEVIDSRSGRFQQGDVVIGMFGWQEYYVATDKELRKIDPSLAPISTHLGILGMTGLTAYFGLLDIGQPKEGETVVISGAAGAVGSVVGQIAKIKGAHVVGIAGSNEKVQYLKEDLKFDEAINYRSTDNMEAALKATCPNGIDVYFDNVGGEISDAVFTQLNRYARIPVCGAISAYNLEKLDLGPRVQTMLIKKSALMQGFTVGNYADRFNEGAVQLGQWLQEGKLKYRETIKEGFENIPNAFLDLFKGNNVGKLLVKVADHQYRK
ncbi:NADP-dependent oxidoreductase [Lederbergia galactosidilytica]|uniref:Alcohol dehydrogenase n=1 Tax=Lederbergia galactosidilytica TaxID=217031 RepID=A0A178A5T7_9BACI|nr:NADP-dependent oxidoreductase [Lederbergia galactosidilytica]MBP1915073.1 NADPH-dependent curcumin reductase CurA [Lederbergia galactosidilytica]OAK75557.1 alcohol dehydrogenase [Lederbergia galactosidilytica]